jgi:hypothetical protein
MSALRRTSVLRRLHGDGPVYSTVHAPSRRRRQVVSLDENFLGPAIAMASTERLRRSAVPVRIVFPEKSP